ncbi:MAG: 6,7-dimethyl-8-ribityllumazine synthase [Candidatus Omnitrophota bacterium]
MKTPRTKNNTRGKKICVVASRFNDFISEKLLAGCLDELTKQGVKKDQILTHWVPGSFEIPVVALKCALKKSTVAVICLGAVIRGETLHFEHIARCAADGIKEVALLTKKPIIFGVLTTDTVDQAEKRCQVKGPNKGREAAQAALDMIDLFKQL